MSEVVSFSPDMIVKTEFNVSVGNNDDNSNNNFDENGDAENDTSGLHSNYDTTSDGGTSVHRCDRCDNYETHNESNLVSHIATCQGNESNNDNESQTNRKLFECDICNMKFSNGANMRRHKMRHTGVKPYECKICQKRFFRKDHLAEHFTTHTKTLPFHCPICNRGFQRQIAMRAHFQNEHVGQHDMVKSCPLCNFRASSMKSLRVHFFNRHGIDLDNPGVGMMNSTSTNNLTVDFNSGNISNSGACSDSGESISGNRSESNATPPMHFLTPHVEISMAEPNPLECSSFISPPIVDNSVKRDNVQNANNEEVVLADNDCPNSPQSTDSNSNLTTLPMLSGNTRQEGEVSTITPSVSLIPIKQEQGEEPSRKSNLNASHNGETESGRYQSAANLSSLIKLSPLKSLLRDEFNRKINLIKTPESSQPPNNDPNFWKCMAFKKTLQCSFCGIAFPDQTLYFLHKGCHSETNPWKCNICGEQCSNVYEFNSHLLSKNHQ
ncbi:zinc finger protein ztf-16 [Adelges cooleyi]|uniref:zinc finger protein ztf-16 n=1 Tax=Adelges cooleyi TaxID=133065 RepID=UPI00217F5586|nr:zinc finger protein ztf-16 [Adelges cooleyi]XP_050426044.1 zinc finger protein ztf-16 [Adelges cooleyi]